MLRTVVLLLGIVVVPIQLSAATIIHAGRLIDGEHDDVRTEVSIVVEDNKITKVVAGYLEPTKDDTLIKLTDHTVMPGLMDMHTHLISQFSKDAYTEEFFLDE